MDMVIHLQHHRDGYPLCWPMGKNGKFEASEDEKKVTCKQCFYYLAEMDKG